MNACKVNTSKHNNDISCECCKLSFTKPKKQSHKSHLLNNITFCYKCRIIYRAAWKFIVLKAANLLKKVIPVKSIKSDRFKGPLFSLVEQTVL